MVMVVDIKVFILSASLKTLRSCGLVVDDWVDGKDNHEDETTEFILNILCKNNNLLAFSTPNLFGVLTSSLHSSDVVVLRLS